MIKRALYVAAMFFPVIITIIGLALALFSDAKSDVELGWHIFMVSSVIAGVVHYICVWIGEGQDS